MKGYIQQLKTLLDVFTKRLTRTEDLLACHAPLLFSFVGWRRFINNRPLRMTPNFSILTLLYHLYFRHLLHENLFLTL